MEQKYTLEMVVTIDEDELFPGQTIEELILDHLEDAPLQIDRITIKGRKYGN